jgi:hypothetical protein
MYRAVTRSFINVVGNIPRANFLDLNWQGYPPVLLYYGSSFRNMSVSLLDAGGYDSLVDLFNYMVNNDYTITVTGAVSDNTKLLLVDGISGKGSISFSGSSLMLGGVSIQNVSCSVYFLDLEIQQTSLHGLYVKDSPNVMIHTFAASFGVAPATTGWTLLSLKNGVVRLQHSTFDGSFTSASTPHYLIRVDSGSYLMSDSGFSMETNAVSGSSYGYAMILLEKGARFDWSRSYTFGNWAANFAAQIEAINYPTNSAVFYFTSNASWTVVKAMLENIESIDCGIQVSGIANVACTGFVLSNISGSGSLQLSCDFISDNVISDCMCKIILFGCTARDQSVAGLYGLSIINCPNVDIGTLELDAGTRAYECLLISGSSIYGNLYYVNSPTAAYTNYVDVVDSNAYFALITSGAGDTTESIFISVNAGSRVHVNSWVSHDVSTTKLQFNEIVGASYVIGWTSAVSGYSLSMMTAACVIIEL